MKFSHAFMSTSLLSSDSGASLVVISIVVAESVLPVRDNRKWSESGTSFFCEINSKRIGVDEY